jgi:hypothetical protein
MIATSFVELDQDRPSGLRGLLASWLLGWSERRHAVRASFQLLKLYRSLSLTHPGLMKREIYGLVVQARTGCDATQASAILRNAQESFAQWPAQRELSLCDVVHYLSVTEFLAKHAGENWIHTNMSHVVAAHVPRELCIARQEA